MFLCARRDGSVFSHLCRRVPRLRSPVGTPSPHVRLRSATTHAAFTTAASPRPPLIRCSYQSSIARPQQRVLRTSSHTKGLQHPRTAALPINWSTTAHRIRHISPSVMGGHTHSRGHAGHSHHHHNHDNTLLLSKNKNDAGVRITKIGLYVNLGMAVSKGVGGYVFNSQGKLMSFTIKKSFG